MLLRFHLITVSVVVPSPLAGEGSSDVSLAFDSVRGATGENPSPGAFGATLSHKGRG